MDLLPILLSCVNCQFVQIVQIELWCLAVQEWVSAMGFSGMNELFVVQVIKIIRYAMLCYSLSNDSLMFNLFLTNVHCTMPPVQNEQIICSLDFIFSLFIFLYLKGIYAFRSFSRIRKTTSSSRC